MSGVNQEPPSASSSSSHRMYTLDELRALQRSTSHYLNLRGSVHPPPHRHIRAKIGYEGVDDYFDAGEESEQAKGEDEEVAATTEEEFALDQLAVKSSAKRTPIQPDFQLGPLKPIYGLNQVLYLRDSNAQFSLLTRF